MTRKNIKENSDQNDQAKDLRDLTSALVEMNDPQELEDLFQDLLTPAEYQSIQERWRVAQLLQQGLPYREINQRTGVSTATITRVARSLTYGNGGYKNLLLKVSQDKDQGLPS